MTEPETPRQVGHWKGSAARAQVFADKCVTQQPLCNTDNEAILKQHLKATQKGIVMPNSTDIPEADPFALSQEEKTAYTKALSNAFNQISNVISTWQACFGYVPDRQGFDQMTNITRQVLSWSDPRATVDEVRNSRNIWSLLDNSPPSAQPILPAFHQYLQVTSSVSKIQQKLVSQIK